MPDDDELHRQVRKLAVDHAEIRWLALRLDDDVKEVREDLRAVRDVQQEHTARFDSIDNQLGDHSSKLDDHSRKLDDHSRKLDDHSRQLDDHSRLLQEHTARFDSVDAQLRSLTQLVGQVLDRLPDGPGT